MNISEIKEKFPTAYKAIFDEGNTAGFQAGYNKGAQDWCEAGRLHGSQEAVTAERERIAGIQAAAFPGQEALVAELTKDGIKLADAVLKLNAAYKETLNQHKAAFNDDGTPVVPGAKLDEPNPKKEAKDFSALISEYVEAHKCSKGEAIQAIARTNPDAHAAYIQAMNKGGK